MLTRSWPSKHTKTAADHPCLRSVALMLLIITARKNKSVSADAETVQR